MTRVFSAVAASCVLLGVLLGVPWLLLQWGKVADLLTVDWATVLTRPDDGRLTLALLTVIGWLAWSMFAASVVSEVLAVVTRDRLRLRLPGMGWLRPAVGVLVAAALAPLLASGAHASPSLTPVEAVVHHPAELAPSTPEPEVPPPAGLRYEVQSGDELWSIAETLLGDGTRWRELVAANPGIDIEATLVPGTVLTIPAPEAPATVTVEAGDSLWSLAEEHLGDGERWPELHEANADQIENPDLIDIGWVLTLPAADTPPEPVTTPEPVATPSTGVPRPEAASITPAPSPPAPESSAAPIAVAPDPREAAATSTLSSSEDPVQLLGPIGGLLAAGIVAGISLRRRSLMHHRPIGRRPIPLNPQLRRWWTALARAQGGAAPGGLAPTSVLLGWHGDGAEEWIDVESRRCLWVTGPQQGVLAVAAAAWTSLLTAEWSDIVDVVAVHPREDWEQAMDDPRLRTVPTSAQALAELHDLCARRRVGMGTRTLIECRADPDTGVDLVPTVFMFLDPLTATQARSIEAALALGQVGVSVIAALCCKPPTLGHHLHLEAPDQARLDGGPRFLAQVISAPARRALVGLFAASTDPPTEPAPWWNQVPGPQPVSALPRSHSLEDAAMTSHSPTLLLLGDVDLVSTAGPRPPRAVGRCLESCAWLLANPGSTPTEMRTCLMVAESTRRSNMSRLRAWLGSGPDGAYLPDAYSGQIRLADAVTSDWERFQSLLAGGIDQASGPVLEEALSLVRGSPLGTFSFQWGWAEQLRSDMVAMIVDASATLADRSLAARDYAVADWALSQGILAAGEVEPLVARSILLSAHRGDREAVDRQVLALTRQARAAGRDLSAESVRIIQTALGLSREAQAPGVMPVGS